MDDTLNTGDLFDGDAYPSREELIEENARLRRQLQRQREENDFLAGMLVGSYDHVPDQEIPDRPPFPISDEAIDLFEELPEAFSLDEAFEEAERTGMRMFEAAGLVRIYLIEEMIVQDKERGRFIKTGRKPYF